MNLYIKYSFRVINSKHKLKQSFHRYCSFLIYCMKNMLHNENFSLNKSSLFVIYIGSNIDPISNIVHTHMKKTQTNVH